MTARLLVHLGLLLSPLLLLFGLELDAQLLALALELGELSQLLLTLGLLAELLLAPLLLDLLGDTENTNYPIFRTGNKDNIFTLATALFDFKRAELRVWDRCNPRFCEHSFIAPIEDARTWCASATVVSLFMLWAIWTTICGTS
jgi:hypothetical protein